MGKPVIVPKEGYLVIPVGVGTVKYKKYGNVLKRKASKPYPTVPKQRMDRTVYNAKRDAALSLALDKAQGRDIPRFPQPQKRGYVPYTWNNSRAVQVMSGRAIAIPDPKPIRETPPIAERPFIDGLPGCPVSNRAKRRYLAQLREKNADPRSNRASEWTALLNG